jgi:hypothetical protein
MKVLLPESLFEAPPSFFVETLVTIAQQRGHRLVAEFDWETSSIFARWVAGLRPKDADALRSALRAGLTAAQRERIDAVVRAHASTSNWHDTPRTVGGKELLELLTHPLIIVVENETHDEHFIRAMPFGTERDTFFEAIKAGQIKFDMGGGSSLRALVESRSRSWIWSHRAWVIFDSDALLPGEPSEEAKAKERTCRDSGVHCYCLKRREAENYLPPSELEEHFRLHSAPLDRRKAAGAFARMTPDQRAHFDLKEGFNGDANGVHVALQQKKETAKLERISKHYDSVPPNDRAALGSGFSKEIADLFRVDIARNRAGISEARRRQDRQDAEMVPLFRNILAWL